MEAWKWTAQGNVCRRIVAEEGRREIAVDVVGQGGSWWWDDRRRHSVLQRKKWMNQACSRVCICIYEWEDLEQLENIEVPRIPIHAKGRNHVHFSYHSADVATAVHALLHQCGKHRLCHGCGEMHSP